MNKIHNIIGWILIILFQNKISMESKVSLTDKIQGFIELGCEKKMNSFFYALENPLEELNNFTNDKCNTLLSKERISYVKNPKCDNINSEGPLKESDQKFVELFIDNEQTNKLTFVINDSNEIFLNVCEFDRFFFKEKKQIFDILKEKLNLLYIPIDEEKTIFVFAKYESIITFLDTKIKQPTDQLEKIDCEKCKLLEKIDYQIFKALLEKLPEKLQEKDSGTMA